MTRSNEQWARRIISRLDPSYQPRWEIYDAFVRECANSSKRCLNIGSGIYEDPEFNFEFQLTIDTDILHPLDPKRRTIPFVQSDLYHLPFSDGVFNVVLLRFVVEHLDHPQHAFQELNRILTPGGQIVIITTNLMSPLIWAGRLLPYGLRKFLIKKLYGVADDDVFPTYHRLNTRGVVKKLEPQFIIRKWRYLQDVNWNRRWLFAVLFAFHLKTKWLGLHILRSNFITVLEKSTDF